MTQNQWLLIGLALGAVFAAIAFSNVLGRPRYLPKAIMTGNELEFFRRLSRAHNEGFVFPQVAMSALLEPKALTRNSRLAAFRRISQKRVDYTLHEPDLSLICVVELDDRTHDASKDAARDAMLRSAGIPTMRWSSTSKPSIAEIRDRVSAIRKSHAPRSTQGRAL